MRALAAIVLGSLMGIMLFWVMQMLIAGDKEPNITDDALRMTDVIRVKPDEVTNLKQRRKPPPPPPPKKPPPPPKLKVNQTTKPVQQQIDINVPNIKLGVATGGGPYLGGWQSDAPPPEGDVIPIVRINPQYPRTALLDGTEGWVKLRLLIAADGTVANAEVMEAEPGRVFNRAAIRAVLKWKFKPRVVAGQAVTREAEQIIEFKLGQEQ